MRTTQILCLSVLLAATMALHSCRQYSDDNPVVGPSQPDAPGFGSPTTEQDENSTVTYQYSTEVLPLSQEAKKKYLVKVESDSILYFLPSTPDSLMPKVGEIISSRISDETPYGLGNKVLTATKEDGLVKVVTTTAQLDEIFTDLVADAEFSIEDLLVDKEGFYDEEGNYYPITLKDMDEVFPERARTRTRGAVGSDKVVEIPIKYKDEETGLFANATLDFGLIFRYNNDFVHHTFEYSIEPMITIGGEFGLSVGDSLNMKDFAERVDGMEVYNKLVDLIKKTKLFESVVQVGPITLRPFIDYEAFIVGTIEGHASVGVGYKLALRCGYTQDGWFCKNESDAFLVENLIKKMELKGRVEMGPRCGIHLGCGLYTSRLNLSIDAYPTVMFGAELGLGWEPGKRAVIADQKLTADFLADVSGSLNVDLKFINFKKETPTARVNMFHAEWPIFPELNRSSFNVQEIYHDPLALKTSYSLTGGLLTWLLGGKPGLRAEQDGTTVAQQIDDDTEVSTYRETEVEVNVMNLDANKQAKLYPLVAFGDMVYEWEPFNYPDTEQSIDTCPDGQHPHILDLGLPSGTKWACCNLGAREPVEGGDLYMWGETTPRDPIEERYENYQYKNGEYSGSTTSYQYIGTDIAGTKYDAAMSHWSSPWCMPSKQQFQELLDNCQAQYIEVEYSLSGNVYKHSGYIFTGPNGNKVYIPFTRMTNFSKYWTSFCDWYIDQEGTPRYCYGIPCFVMMTDEVKVESGGSEPYHLYSIRPVR